MPHHSHSHVDGEVCEQTPIDVDVDLEHGHRLHNHRHHTLHQHVSNEWNVGSSKLVETSTYCHPDSTNNTSSCVPCAYSNEIRANVPLMSSEIVGNEPTANVSTPHAIVSAEDKTSIGDKSKCKE